MYEPATNGFHFSQYGIAWEQMNSI